MHQDLTKIIFFFSILKFDSACQKKRTDKNDDENFCKRFERDRKALQQKRCKTSEEQNNHSNRRRNEHVHRSHEKRVL
jgi:hypothetical protein